MNEQLDHVIFLGTSCPLGAPSFKNSPSFRYTHGLTDPDCNYKKLRKNLTTSLAGFRTVVRENINAGNHVSIQDCNANNAYDLS